LVTFAKAKVTRAQRESLGLDLTTSAGRVLLTFVAMIGTKALDPSFRWEDEPEQRQHGSRLSPG
jgi:hypothetical protein